MLTVTWQNPNYYVQISDSVIADTNKIKLEKQHFAAVERVRKASEINKIECIGADRKKDRKTLKKTISIVNGVEVVKTVKGTEEHVAYTTEPDGEYLLLNTQYNN